MASRSPTSNRIVEAHLQEMVCALEEVYGADCLSYVGPITFGVDDAIRDALEELPGSEEAQQRRNKLIFILETNGGYAETARRISDTLRHHYTVVDFIIPSHAMSAGTILALSGDAIHMDYYSVLGPIDPQIPGPDGNLIPALGYLVRYQELLAKANRGRVSTAEMNILLSFDQGQLYAYEQARELSLSLLKEWLVKYKFKDWSVTKTRNKSVSTADKRKRAKEVAEKLNDVKMWNSHGIGISMEMLRRDLKLLIDDFGETKELGVQIRHYHSLMSDFMARMGHKSAVHNRRGYKRLV